MPSSLPHGRDLNMTLGATRSFIQQDSGKGITNLVPR
jgi:hypothetical protein